MGFSGEYRHAIDAKGRLIVPSQLRSELGSTVHLSRWLDRCIGIWSEESWNKITAKLEEAGSSDFQTRRFVRQFMSSSVSEEIDKQGRVSIPQKLRDLAGISKDAVIIGSLTHVEVWDPERWDMQDSDEDGASFEELAAGLEF